MRRLITIMGLSSLLNIFMPMTIAAIDPNCDFFQQLQMGQEYYIYNKEYPGNYSSGTSCRWTAQSDPGTIIILSCEDINIPSSPGCQGDRLAISLTGNENFDDAKNYCGKGNLTLISQDNKLTIGLLATGNSIGGRFVCTLTSFSSGPPTTTTEGPNMCNCGWKQGTRIVGGHETGVNEYPAMAALINLYTTDLMCGATIIADQYALTAAHCLLHEIVNNYVLLVGDHNISSGADTTAAAAYPLAQFIPHPEYSEQTHQNDIAIVRTSKRIVFSILVGPICLPFRYTYNTFDNDIVTALGWGFIEFTGPKSDVLQGVDLSVVSNIECAEKIPDPVIYSQMCTYTPGKDACLSDSGGPLLWQDPNTRALHLIGIISYGLGCATQNPGVNTRVTSFLSWIVSTASDAHYCIK